MGSYVLLEDTGIILNNEMDDFSTPGKINDFGLPPSPANFITPFQRPISSMCPNIVLDSNNDAVFISGSAGGSKITTTVAFVSGIFRHFFFSKHGKYNETLVFYRNFRCSFITFGSNIRWKRRLTPNVFIINLCPCTFHMKLVSIRVLLMGWSKWSIR